MNIRAIPIEQLQPAPYNPRVGLQPGDEAYARLERSLSEFDLVQPPVWNARTGHIVGGHQRVEILRRRGVREVDCVVLDLPLEREQALNIALNNPRVGGDWDPDRLIDLLEELHALPDFDVTLTGFDDQSLRDLVLTPDEFGRDDPPEIEADCAERDQVTVILHIPAERWPRVELQLNEIVADEPDIEVHVRGDRG
ncbi:MAG: ParB N-terminal domain-containing protein [Planctomycetaceae bacterium]|nr:ParB N-terminal domain-containing protein [Planctomycetaceae bacterium]